MGSLQIIVGRGAWGTGFSPESRKVQAAISGDRTAFDELVAQHEPEIRRFVAKKIIAESVDDVLQDVWLATWAALPSFDQRSRFKTWVYGICLHKIRDHYRSLQRRLPEIELCEQTLAATNFGADVALASSIGSMLANLTESQREVLELYYFSQLNLPEISRTLNRNLNTVKYQFYRAHSELADMFEEEMKV